MHSSCNISDVQKFGHLHTLLEGDAKEAIRGLSLTGSHYAIARELLEKRFGRKERIILKHVQELFALKQMSLLKLSV